MAEGVARSARARIFYAQRAVWDSNAFGCTITLNGAAWFACSNLQHGPVRAPFVPSATLCAPQLCLVALAVHLFYS